MDVSTRADSAAANAVANAEFRVKRIGAWVSGIGVLVALLVAIFGIWQPIKEVRTDLENVKNLLQIKENKSRLDKVDEIENLKQQIIKLENRLTGETVKAPGGQK